MTTEVLIDELFDRLDEWRGLPSYQLERRTDIFFAIYLKDIINKKYNQTVDYIIPEFPLRIGNIYSNFKLANPNLSFKIDYLVVCNSTRKVFLVELKTDSNSRREKQDKYLNTAKDLNIKNLVDGVLKIYEATSSKKKYQNLLNILARIGWLNTETLSNTSTDYEVSILYIQPNPGKETEDVITFADLINYLSSNNDKFTTRFLKSLKEWTKNPND